MFLWFLWSELLRVVVTDCKSATSGKLYLTMQNSDGTGSYAAIFVFQNGKFLEKQVVVPF